MGPEGLRPASGDQVARFPALLSSGLFLRPAHPSKGWQENIRPQTLGFWLKGDKRSVGTGGPLWRPARPGQKPVPALFGAEAERAPGVRHSACMVGAGRRVLARTALPWLPGSSGLWIHKGLSQKEITVRLGVVALSMPRRGLLSVSSAEGCQWPPDPGCLDVPGLWPAPDLHLREGSAVFWGLSPLPLRQLDGRIWRQGPAPPQDPRVARDSCCRVGRGSGGRLPCSGLAEVSIAVHSLTGFPEELAPGPC